MYSLVVHNSVCQITPLLPQPVSLAIDDIMAFGIQGAQFTAQYKAKQWDGKKRLYSTRKQTFPTGYLSEVVAKLEELGVEYKIQDAREIPALDRPVIPLTLPPWEHQKRVFETCSAVPRGLIQIATGGGKSVVAAGIYGMMNVPTVLITQRKELMYQLRNSLQKSLGEPVGILGDGVYEEGRLTVCMIQTLAKLLGVKYASLVKEFSDRDDRSDTLIKGKQAELYKKLILEPRMVLADECHHLSANSSYAVAQAMVNAYWRYGLSATAFGFREDGKDFFVKAAIGDVITRVTTTDLVNVGHLVPTDIIEIPYSHKGRHYPKDSYATYYDHAVTKNDDRNRLIVEMAYGLYKRGKNVLVAVQRVDHGKLLEEYLQYLVGPQQVKFIYGEDESGYRREHLGAFADKKLPILISTLVSEGVDWPHLSTTINCRGEESRIATIQLMGRSMRKYPGKEKALYIDIMDEKSSWLAKHAKTRKSVYDSEPVFKRLQVQAAHIKSFVEGYG